MTASPRLPAHLLATLPASVFPATLRALIVLAAALLAASGARADPADVEAAARGVVRVVLIADDGEEIRPLTHGTGFAVTPTLIVTNAHVIREALQDDTLRIGIVPSEAAGEEASGAFARAIAVSPRNDLALLEIASGGLRLPPLTLAAGAGGGSGEVSAVGYPMNVDLAQGLAIDDIFSAQPPVMSRGFLSGERPSRQFDTILHTAPIARGNSGGPLLDGCGRVVGVNSFGADSDGSDAEFYFAVSLRELLPFLRANEVEPRVNAMPCRSIDELNAAERARFEAEREEARARLAAREARLREAREEAQLKALIAISQERDDAMAFAVVLLLIGLGGGAVALHWRNKAQGAKAPQRLQRLTLIAAGLSGAALIAAAFAWLTRPGFAEIDDRVAALMSENGLGEGPPGAGSQTAAQASDGTLLCTFQPDRSRVMGARTDDVEFQWVADGCVNGRTQYGFAGGEWMRVFVPNDEAAVSINVYDPETRLFRTDRYLLSRGEMEEARALRSAITPPACGVSDAAQILGEQQSALIGALPERPNERLVYSCRPKGSAPAADAGDQAR
ncbi:MAG: serine protease [Erythrobacter sp.]|jgi:hypothetical protein|nr:serine protease [Erythrobacter sp.]